MQNICQSDIAILWDTRKMLGNLSQNGSSFKGLLGVSSSTRPKRPRSSVPSAALSRKQQTAHGCTGCTRPFPSSCLGLALSQRKGAI